MLLRQREEFVSAGGEQRLVGGDDALAGSEGGGDQFPRGGVAADEFDHHVHIVGDEGAQVGGERCAADGHLGLRRAACHPPEFDAPSGAGRDALCRIADEQRSNGLSHRAEASEPHPQRPSSLHRLAQGESSSICASSSAATKPGSISPFGSTIEGVPVTPEATPIS